MIWVFETAMGCNAVFSASCEFAICDANKAVLDFTNLVPMKDQTQRKKRELILKNYVQAASLSQEVDELEKYVMFGLKIKSFMSDGGDEEWMIGLASQLVTISRIRLAEFSPLISTILTQEFSNLTDENSRSQVIQFWNEKIKDYEDSGSLLQLAHFFSESAKTSLSFDDDDYVVQMAINAEQSVYSRINDVSPINEGVYELEAHCQDASHCPLKAADRIVILNTFTEEGIRVSFTSSKIGVILLNFQSIQVSEGGTQLQAITRDSGHSELTRLDLFVNSFTQTLSGAIQTVDSTYSFDGKLVQGSSFTSYFDQINADGIEVLPLSVFYSPLKGKFDSELITLNVSVFGSNQIGGTLSFDSIPGLRLQFSAGKFFEKSHVLLLSGIHAGNGNMKLAVKFQNENKGDSIVYRGTGIAFSTLNGLIHTLTFEVAK